MDSSVIIYDENRPYIFISYAHKDCEMVYDIIRRLSMAGYNIWYDRGIEAGSNWDDYIASHIDKCSYFMAFLSDNYLKSGNCKDELNYARDLDKDFLLIYLQEVKLPSGMAMRLNRSQAVMWNEADDLFAGEDFAKILKARGIEKTLRDKNVSGKVMTLSGDAIHDNKCPNCSAELPDRKGENSVLCSYCGSRIFYDIPKAPQPHAPGYAAQTPGNASTYAAQTPNAAAQAAQAAANAQAAAKKKSIITAVVISAAILFISIILFIAIGFVSSVTRIRKTVNSALDTPAATTDVSTSSDAQTVQTEPTKEATLPLEASDFVYWVNEEKEYETIEIWYLASITNPNENAIPNGSRFKVTAKDTAGHVIDTDECYISDILPGDHAWVLSNISTKYATESLTPELTYEAYCSSLNGYSKSELETRTDDIEIFNTYVQEGSYNSHVITGEVTNHSKKDAELLEIALVFTKDGAPVYMDREFIDVMAGKTQSFSKDIYGELPEYDELKVYPILY